MSGVFGDKATKRIAEFNRDLKSQMPENRNFASIFRPGGGPAPMPTQPVIGQPLPVKPVLGQPLPNMPRAKIRPF
jgi:hypothetical protein